MILNPAPCIFCRKPDNDQRLFAPEVYDRVDPHSCRANSSVHGLNASLKDLNELRHSIRAVGFANHKTENPVTLPKLGVGNRGRARYILIY